LIGFQSSSLWIGSGGPVKKYLGPFGAHQALEISKTLCSAYQCLGPKGAHQTQFCSRLELWPLTLVTSMLHGGVLGPKELTKLLLSWILAYKETKKQVTPPTTKKSQSLANSTKTNTTKYFQIISLPDF